MSCAELSAMDSVIGKSLTAYKVGDQVLFSDDILYPDGDKVMYESWIEGAELTATQTKKADPARVPEREKIVRLLGENGHMTTKTLPEAIGITIQAVRKRSIP